jgi:uncharacterized membrane protein YebE (DUF533 family)
MKSNFSLKSVLVAGAVASVAALVSVDAVFACGYMKGKGAQDTPSFQNAPSAQDATNTNVVNTGLNAGAAKVGNSGSSFNWTLLGIGGAIAAGLAGTGLYLKYHGSQKPEADLIAIPSEFPIPVAPPATAEEVTEETLI